MGEKIFQGVPVSDGVCRAKVLVLGKSHVTIPHRSVAESQVTEEVGRLEKALVKTREDILEIQRKISHEMGSEDSGIFDAHLLVLEDPTLIEEVTRHIHQNKVNAEHSFHVISERYAETLARTEDEYLRERAADMRDVTLRVLNNLMGRVEEVDLKNLTEPCILITHDLTPSTTAQLDKRTILGFATDIGGKTSHSAIMARSLGIPAVVALKTVSEELKTGEYVLLDGFNGMVVLNPTDQTLFEYGQLKRRKDTLQEKLRDTLEQPAVTLDGQRITLSANIEGAENTQAVRDNGAHGVGLFRTEYLFLNRESPPGEDEQFEEYRKVAAALKPSPVIIRTIDLGGDKLLPGAEAHEEMNPFLGWRAIRFCLNETAVFRSQLRAILRASAEGNVKLMYPMISSLEEIKQANVLVEECKAELRAENRPFDEGVEIGAMIETPAAAVVAGSLARRLKFLSLGTNDLIQYTLAVDRMNEKIAHLFDPTHPAVVKLIKTTVDAAHQNNIWVGVCGEMAGDPVLVPLLLGLGVDELSAAPPLVPTIKFLIRRLKMAEARQLADFALNCESSGEILKASQLLARNAAPSLFENNI